MQYNYGNNNIFGESLPTIPKLHPNFFGIFCFYFIMLIPKTCLFNNSCIVGCNIQNHFHAPLLITMFPSTKIVVKGTQLGLGGFG